MTDLITSTGKILLFLLEALGIEILILVILLSFILMIKSIIIAITTK